MAIAFRCGECNRYYEVADSFAGKQGKCKGCGAIFEVPTPGVVDDPYGPDDPYALEAAPAPAAESLAGPKPKKKKKRGNVFAMSSLPPWGFGAYLGAIVATLLVALFLHGQVRALVAVLAGFLCMGPFIATGFARQYGVPFRDGLVSGLMYMFVFPYRIHYRLTHREEFARVELPRFARRDLLLFALTVPSLWMLLRGAEEADKPRPNHVVVHRPAAPPPEAQPAPRKKPMEEARKKAGAPELKGPGTRHRERERELPEMTPRRDVAPPVPTRPVAPSSFDQREGIAQAVRGRLEELVTLLATVVDVPTARDVAPRLREIVRAFDDDQRQLDRLRGLSGEDAARLRAAHDDATRAAADRYAAEAARVAAIPGVAAVLPRDLLAFRPFVPGTNIRIVLATPRPAMPGPMPVAPPPVAGGDSAVTINVGATDRPTNQAINAALIELLKAGGNNWSLRSNTAGGRTWFTASPVDDVQAFADRLTFARETKVSGRTIDLIVDPDQLAPGPH